MRSALSPARELRLAGSGESKSCCSSRSFQDCGKSVVPGRPFFSFLMVSALPGDHEMEPKSSPTPPPPLPKDIHAQSARPFGAQRSVWESTLCKCVVFSVVMLICVFFCAANSTALLCRFSVAFLVICSSNPLPQVLRTMRTR